jgi:hypothetical protein
MSHDNYVAVAMIVRTLAKPNAQSSILFELLKDKIRWFNNLMHVITSSSFFYFEYDFNGISVMNTTLSLLDDRLQIFLLLYYILLFSPYHDTSWDPEMIISF